VELSPKATSTSTTAVAARTGGETGWSSRPMDGLMTSTPFHGGANWASRTPEVKTVEALWEGGQVQSPEVVT
jgi:hypothetical protein